MVPIPVKVSNVSVYPYIDWPKGGGVGPVIPPVITGASGTYSVGTLLTSVFYNLDLEGGERPGDLVVHGRYTAVGLDEQGHWFSTPWMYCLDNGVKPTFGRTQTIPLSPQSAVNDIGPCHVPAYIDLGPLSDITVTQPFPPPAIGQIPLIDNGVGEQIATKVGTPHMPGVIVKGGDRQNELHCGMSGIMISGKNKDGQIISFNDMTCVSVEPATFIRYLV